MRLANTLRLILVGLLWHRPGDPRTPLGQASIAAALRVEADVEVTSLAFPVEDGPDPAAIAEQILCHADDRTDIALGAYVWNEQITQAVLDRLRGRGFAGRIILGGPQVSYAGQGLEKFYPQVDLFVRGYAERALCELYAGARPTTIPGIHVAGQPDLCTVAEAPLESLPSPYTTGVLPLEFDAAANRRFVRWETQRGCPYRCSFCQHREAGARLKQTRFLMDRLEAEIVAFVEAGVDAIAVLDPVFNTRGHGERVLGALRSAGYRGRLSLQCRFEGLTETFLDALEGLDVTIELGLQTIHLDEGKVIQRFNKPDCVERGLTALRARGIDHEVSLIYGLPLQTLASFRESVDWCLRRDIPRVKAFPLMLLRGTPLERDRARWALVENEDPIPAVVASSTFDRRDHAHMARLAAALVATEDAHPRRVEALELIAVDAWPVSSPRRRAS